MQTLNFELYCASPYFPCHNIYTLPAAVQEGPPGRDSPQDINLSFSPVNIFPTTANPFNLFEDPTIPPPTEPNLLEHPRPKTTPCANMLSKPDFVRRRNLRDSLILSVTVAMIVVYGVRGFHTVQLPALEPPATVHQVVHIETEPPFKRLLFYNRPPKTGSTSVRIAMKNALEARQLVSAKCFNMIEWNEMALRTIVNRRNVDFYGCHTRMYRERFLDVVMLRGGNVTFMTSTREPSDIILSAYLQHNRDKNVGGITDPAEMKREVERYKQHVENYPINALYDYHGVEEPLTECPYTWAHVKAMRKIAERYEIVVDLERPQESSAMVEAVTGLKPDFSLKYNERTKDKSPMLQMLMAVNTSHKSCGNELVHKVLSQQFNIIKDRLMQNRCFDEDSGSFEICDKTQLSSKTIIERTRKESFKERSRLRK